MLFSVALLFVHWFKTFKERRRMNQLVRMIEEASGLGSLVVRRMKWRDSRGLSESPDLPSFVLEPSTRWRSAPVSDENGITISTVSPKLHVELVSEWTSYLHNQSYPSLPTPTADPDKLFLLIEACHNDNESDFLEQLLSNVQKFKLTDYANPIAWRSGEPFGIVAECTLTNLAKLTMAFVDGLVTLDDMLELQSISTVQLKGHATNLLRVNSKDDVAALTNTSATQRGNSNSNHDSNLLRKTLVKEEENFRGSNESLAHGSSAGDASFRVEPNSSTCSNFGDSEVNTEFLEDVEAGEALSASLAELAPELMTPAKRCQDNKSKPPNVLVYCGEDDAVSKQHFQNISELLKQCLNGDRYVVYQLRHEQVTSTPWQDNCILLVIACQRAQIDKFLEYHRNGGAVLSFGSTFDKYFISRSASGDEEELVLIDYKIWEKVYTLAASCRYTQLKTSLADTTIVPLATEADSDTCLAVEATNELTNGVALLSQVRLDKDPSVRGDIQADFIRLKQSNPCRFGILRDWLQKLGLDCTSTDAVSPTPYWLLATDLTCKTDVLTAISGKFEDNLVAAGDFSMQLCDTFTAVRAGSGVTPVITVNDPQLYQFNMAVYERLLKTRQLGRLVLYSDVVTSTMDAVNCMMMHLPDNTGLVAVAERQTSGLGRGGNAWLSPVGCAMFSLHLRIPLASVLGQKAGFIQHIASLAVVEAVRTTPGYQDIDLRLKWPNDIYFGRTMKLGGVIVKSTVLRDTIHCNIGCGFNVTNKNPTVCINDLVEQHNMHHQTQLAPFTTEHLIATTINNIERLVDAFQKDGCKGFENAYYKRWLHTNAPVAIEEIDGTKTEATVIGLDEYGYLAVMTPSGEVINVHPDGNSFDMMRNLIVPKAR